ncbi:MAG: hypothetical protein HDT25_00630 [Ruminococcus sp.]|nr:hypothetical protein [Ruminococcus sp.]
MKKFFALTAAMAVCLTVTSCGGNNSLPEDTSAIEQYIEQASETAQAEEASEPTDAVRAKLESMAKEEYVIVFEIIGIEIDNDETERIIDMYKGSELAAERGWSDEALNNMTAVKAEYYVEYDHTKTFFDDGRTEQFFYLISGNSTGGWEIVDTSSPNVWEASKTENPLETTPFEDLSDYDRAIRLAAEHIEEHGADHWEYILYDFDLDGIPELMEETGFKDTIGWEIYKLTGSEAADLGYMEFAGTDERYIKDGIDIIYYHGDELTLESGVHVYRDNENDEIFYVTEYTTELHTKGFAAAIRYDVYADKLSERELYHCDFLSMDDGGESGNRYITHNILDGKKATPMYRCDCNSEGFLYCNEFGDYLSNFEYLGMIDVTNYYKKEKDSSFYDYAETVKIPEKTREERFYSDDREKVTVCGEEYYADTYKAEIVINNDNFDSIDLSELKLLPCLEKLTLLNKSDRTADISKLAELENLSEITLDGGEFDYSQLLDMDNIILAENAPIEYISQMKSIKIVYAYPYTEDIDGFAPLYDMEGLEVVLHNVTGGDFGDPYMNMQLDRLEERRPDLLLIYVP